MAQRPVFCPIDVVPYSEEKRTEFTFYSGFSISQALRSIDSLHEAFSLKNGIPREDILEVSSYSSISLGVQLSAFNLQYTFENGEVYPLESVFQSSKCFSNGKRYGDILYLQAHDAKRDPRLKNSGDIVGFELEGEKFPNEPKTLLYDWLYIRALSQHKGLSEEIMKYCAFTDIAFNPLKSINCQARSAAKFVALKRGGLVEKVLTDRNYFIQIV